MPHKFVIIIARNLPTKVDDCNAGATRSSSSAGLGKCEFVIFNAMNHPQDSQFFFQYILAGENL